MRERPIIFSGPMVRAILDGRKSQTRRVLKPPPLQGQSYGDIEESEKYPGEWFQWVDGGDKLPSFTCPYGQPGDRLWVRETFGWSAKLPLNRKRDQFDRMAYSDLFAYRADNPPGNWCWNSSIFMPRWASRITLDITGVRVDRVQDISEKDAIAEGVCNIADCSLRPPVHYAMYKDIWDSINGKKHPWDGNLWVWVVEFRRL